MAGPVPAMPNDITTRHPGSVFLFTFANTWVDGFEPSHTTERRYGGSAYPDTWKDDFRSGMSPCLAFADKWVDLNPGARVGIVPLGCTGRQLRAFMPVRRENSLFVASTKRLRLACGAGHLGGMIFSQGESDGRDLEDATAWAQRFATLVERWRADFGADLPVCLVKIGLSPQRPDLPYWDLVREQQEIAAASIPNVTIVRTDDLEKRDDRVHFVEAAYVETGETIALALNGADRLKPAAQSLPDMLTRRLHRAARSPRMLENTLADIERESAATGHQFTRRLSAVQRCAHVRAPWTCRQGRNHRQAGGPLRRFLCARAGRGGRTGLPVFRVFAAASCGARTGVRQTASRHPVRG